MAKQQGERSCSKPVSLLVLEGDTEKVFYRLICRKFLKGIRYELRQITSGGNINKQVLSEIFKYTWNNPGDKVRVYCCSDTDRIKCNPTPLDVKHIRTKIREHKMIKVLSVDAILADPEIESWFFLDIESTYKFLRAKGSKRNLQKYRNVHNLGKKDMQKLFERFGHVYIPGKRAENFIRHLNLEKIVQQCDVLQRAIELVKAQARKL